MRQSGRRVIFRATCDHWATPEALYQALEAEFGFIDDPCPLHGKGGLDRSWNSPCFVNPPYSEIDRWMEKAAIEAAQGKTVVVLVPSRTDTRWFHDYAMNATEIRFIRGRLQFGKAKWKAPFPSALIIFKAAA